MGHHLLASKRKLKRKLVRTAVTLLFYILRKRHVNTGCKFSHISYHTSHQEPTVNCSNVIPETQFRAFCFN